MRVLTILFLSLTLCSAVNAQFYSTKSRKAIKLYEEARWTNSPAERESLLLGAIKKDKNFLEAYQLLAKTYAMQDSVDKAINILKPLCLPESPYYSDVLFSLANYYYISGRYNLALSSINSITDMRYFNEIKDLKELYSSAVELIKNPIAHKPINLTKVNTKYDDYFPSVTADGKMLSTTILVPSEYGTKQEDIYCSRQVNGEWTKSFPLSQAVNTDLNNEGAQTFSADGRYMFFVACDQSNGCDIYYSIRHGNKWSRPINLGHPANSEFWESNPVMSASGDKIYFTSNRPGGVGDRDIWSVDVQILSNGYLRCSRPRSLGKPINTENGEWAPYIHSDNETLYFSSNGHGGLGRNDIFMSRNIKGKWTIPMNVGYPINSHGDESGLTVSADGSRAYFASNKLENNNQGLDIYEIILPEKCRPKAMSTKIGIVVDAQTFQPIQAKVEIYDLATNKRFFESLSDKSDGTFTISLPQKGTFGLNVKKEKYLYYGDNIAEDQDTLRVLLKKIAVGAHFDLYNIHFAYDSDSLLIESAVEINRLSMFLKENPNVRIKIVGHTDNQGSKSYNIDLSKRRALSLLNELVNNKKISKARIEYDGLGDTKPVASNDTESGRAENRRVEISIIE